MWNVLVRYKIYMLCKNLEHIRKQYNSGLRYPNFPAMKGVMLMLMNVRNWGRNSLKVSIQYFQYLLGLDRSSAGDILGIVIVSSICRLRGKNGPNDQKLCKLCMTQGPKRPFKFFHWRSHLTGVLTFQPSQSVVLKVFKIKQVDMKGFIIYIYSVNIIYPFNMLIYWQLSSKSEIGFCLLVSNRPLTNTSDGHNEDIAGQTKVLLGYLTKEVG